ncbi:UxaA family hydrolase [Clostridium sp. AM58-1XD]|uniref:UxaA family hydrolase n=1 Tax=Clostridium sp. AM58-1XD TaxID=2292307 RepID=UPI000E4C8636|nr:UxaA family hydrolase [Clostridium sp. AM58-1XD]RGZ00393.1 altronate dehydratase [Clostridium sp. AM58-1XD]
MGLTGYKRSDGKVGIRNKVLILPTCACSSETCKKVADMVEGAVSFTNQNGCSQTNRDVQYTIDTLVGFAANPNVFGTILVGLGCEVCSAARIGELIRQRTNKPLAEFVIQEDGGTAGTIEKASRAALLMAEEASRVNREPVEWSDIILGTECGGTDATSGIGANPVIGAAGDLLVKAGGTVILSETPEFIGAEHLLAARAATPEISEKILSIVREWENYMKVLKTDLRESNPSPGNIKGGVSSLEEKSLGCIYKGGTTTVQDVIGYGKEISAKGLVIMDTPGNDTASLCAMAAGGACVSVFSTGRGTPVGNPVMPVIKITGNRGTYKKMECNMDFDASPVIMGERTADEMGRQLFRMIEETVNGKKTKAEILGMNEVAIARYCNFT